MLGFLNSILNNCAMLCILVAAGVQLYEQLKVAQVLCNILYF